MHVKNSQPTLASNAIQPMFPLTRAWVRACTHVVTQAHTRRLGAHINAPSKNVFCRYFINVIPNSDEGKMLHKRNFMHTQALKIRGNIECNGKVFTETKIQPALIPLLIAKS